MKLVTSIPLILDCIGLLKSCAAPVAWYRPGDGIGEDGTVYEIYYSFNTNFVFCFLTFIIVGLSTNLRISGESLMFILLNTILLFVKILRFFLLSKGDIVLRGPAIQAMSLFLPLFESTLNV